MIATALSHNHERTYKRISRNKCKVLANYMVLGEKLYIVRNRHCFFLKAYNVT